MALIKCKECGNEVSDQAEVCPHCGYNLKKQEQKVETSSQIRKGTIVSLISCVLVVVLLIGLFIMPETPDDLRQEESDVNVEVGFAPSSIPISDLTFFGISLLLTIACIIITILYLCKKFKNIKLYKGMLLGMSIAQLLCAIISISVLVCCGVVYAIFPLMNFIGAIIVATGKN